MKPAQCCIKLVFHLICNNIFFPGADTPTQKTLTYFPFNTPLQRAQTYIFTVIHTFPCLNISYFVVPFASPLQGHSFFYAFSPYSPSNVSFPFLLFLYNISLRQHNHFITQCNDKATCFNYRLVIFRPIFVN